MHLFDRDEDDDDDCASLPSPPLLSKHPSPSDLESAPLMELLRVPTLPDRVISP